MPKYTIDRSEFPLGNNRQYTKDGRIATHVHPGAGHVVVNEQTGEAFPSDNYQGAGVQPLNDWLPNMPVDAEAGVAVLPRQKYVNYHTPIDVYNFFSEDTYSINDVTSSPMTSPPTYNVITPRLFNSGSNLTHQYTYQHYTYYQSAINDPTGYRDYIAPVPGYSWILFQPITTLLEAIPTTGQYLDGLLLWDCITAGQKASIISEWQSYWTATPPDPLNYGRIVYNQDVPGKSGWDYSLHRFYKILYSKLTFTGSGRPCVDQTLHVLRDYVTPPGWPVINQLCVESDSIVNYNIALPKCDIIFAFADGTSVNSPARPIGTCPFSEGQATTAYDQEYDGTVRIAQRQWTIKFTPFGIKFTVSDTAKTWIKSCYWIFDKWVISNVYMGGNEIKAFTLPAEGTDGAKYAALQAQSHTYIAPETWADRKWEDQGDTTSFNFYHEFWNVEMNSLGVKLALSPVSSGHFSPYDFETIIT